MLPVPQDYPLLIAPLVFSNIYLLLLLFINNICLNNQLQMFILDQFDGIFELYPTTMKKLYVVDGGLTFNSPYPH
jgi:hypothetical protein